MERLYCRARVGATRRHNTRSCGADTEKGLKGAEALGVDEHVRRREKRDVQGHRSENQVHVEHQGASCPQARRYISSPLRLLGILFFCFLF